MEKDSQQKELSLLVETSQIEDDATLYETTSETSTTDILRDIHYTPKLFKPMQEIVCKEPSEQLQKQWRNSTEEKSLKKKPSLKNVNSRYLKSTTTSRNRSDSAASNTSSVSLPASPMATLKPSTNINAQKPPKTPKKLRKKKKDVTNGAWGSLTSSLSFNDGVVMPPPPNRTPRACNNNAREEEHVIDDSIFDRREYDDEDMDDVSSIASTSSHASTVTMDSYKMNESSKDWKLNKWRREWKQQQTSTSTAKVEKTPISAPVAVKKPPVKRTISEIGINTDPEPEVVPIVTQPIPEIVPVVVKKDPSVEAVMNVSSLVFDFIEAASHKVERVRSIKEEQQKAEKKVQKRDAGMITEPILVRSNPEQDKMCLCGKIEQVSPSLMHQIAGGVEGDEPIPKTVLVDVRLYHQKESKIPVHTEKGIEAFFELFLKDSTTAHQRSLNVYYYVFVGTQAPLPDSLFESHSDEYQAGDNPALKQSLWYEIAGHNMEGTDSIIVARSPLSCDHVERMYVIDDKKLEESEKKQMYQDEAAIHKSFYCVVDKVFDIKRNTCQDNSEISLRLASHAKLALELMHSQTQVGENAVIEPPVPKATVQPLPLPADVKNKTKAGCKCSIM